MTKHRASWLSGRIGRTCGLLLASWCACGTTEPAGDVLVALVCEQTGERLPELTLLLFGIGTGTTRPSTIRVECRADHERPLFWSADVPIAPDTWGAADIATVPLGGFPWERAPTPSFAVWAGASAGGLDLLGHVTRTDGSARIRRVTPMTSGAAAGAHVIVTATAEPVDARTALLKLVFLNCGEEFTADYSGFVHFDLRPTGEDLAPAGSLGLHPSSARMDTSAWRMDELTVVRFGPFHFPPQSPEHVYVRAGIYDQHGTTARVPLAGSDDGTGRVLVGRFVVDGKAARFERLSPPRDGQTAAESGHGGHDP